MQLNQLLTGRKDIWWAGNLYGKTAVTEADMYGEETFLYMSWYSGRMEDWE